jgi:STE24 endopeptidase
VADLWFLPLVLLVYAAMRRLRRTWWLVSAGAIGVALIAWLSLAPYLIEPLFYRITPLKSEALRSHLDPLFEKAGVERTVLYEARSGEKTREMNAYLSGLFLGRRIVLYNVLAEGADPSELRFVVAHEIGHWKNHHVTKGIAFGTAGAAGCLLLLGILLKLTARKRGHPGTGHYLPGSLPAFFFWLHVILFLIMPIECAISRRFETTADRYALKLTQDPQAAVRLFQRVGRMNLSDINPPPVVKFWLYTHPTIPERIQAALKAGEKPPSTITPPENHPSPSRIPLRGRAPSPKASGSSPSPPLPQPCSLVAVGAVNEVVVPRFRVYLDF